MSHPAAAPIREALDAVPLIDPHTHIDPHAPAAETLADLLGYHYYTELAHSAGMPKSDIESDGTPRERVGRLVENLGPLDNTVQVRWLTELSRRFFDFGGDTIDASNWESLFDAAESRMSSANWADTVLERSNVEAVFLTNDFDDQLDGFDASKYIPCLRTDDLVFHLDDDRTLGRLASATDISLHGSLTSLRDSLDQRFEHFVGSGARACAISLPPTFTPTPVSDGRATRALDAVLQRGPTADPADRDALARRVFWTLAELCDHHGLPFDLMIGVNRAVYADGVHQGRDLYDSRLSLLQYRELFNAFPDVKFPVSVLASVTNQELVSHAWIFPNVYTNGHWWYSNTPSFIRRDAAARLEAIPRTKQIGYYSDAYKLEFVWPKFDMYRGVLADTLAEHFVADRGWSEERAIDLGTQILRGNVETIFGDPRDADDAADRPTELGETIVDDGPSSVAAAVATTAGVAAAAGSLLGQSDEDEDDDGLDGGTLLMDADEQQAIRQAETDALADLDPSPDAAEIDAVGSPDVTLADHATDPAIDFVEPDPAAPPAGEPIGDKTVGGEPIDDEPLVLDESILDEDDVTIVETAADTIRPLAGEGSFQPDDETLKLQPDPTTGEWTFPADDA